jgi:hypothetical protein
MITANGPKPCEISSPWVQMLQNLRQEAVREERRRFSNELRDRQNSRCRQEKLET